MVPIAKAQLIQNDCRPGKICNSLIVHIHVKLLMYRDELNSLQIQLSRTQAGPGRAVKEQQEQNSPNHVQRINLISVE